MNAPVNAIEIEHPRFRAVDRDIFIRRVVADCMTHSCAMHATHTEKLDACCQYGADVDLAERDAILAHADQIRPVLRSEAQHAAWFKDAPPELDAEAPSGAFVRTARLGDGCIFLAHDRRGCAIHRASLEQGWDFHGTKPAVCRLFPLTYGDRMILISDDYTDYSCAYDPGAPTLYRVARATLAAVFGEALVCALDTVEARVSARQLATVR